MTRSSSRSGRRRTLATANETGTLDPQIISAGVDWITVTTPDPASSHVLALQIAGIVDHQKQMGALERPWGMSGFTGFKVGEIEYAMRGDEFMVRLMSDTAQRAWREVYELGASVTRLDLQVTVEMNRDCQSLVWEYYRRANKKSLEKKRGPRNRVILGNDGGATLYCGERSSSRFGRCYAKGPQSKIDYYKTALRFELQLNGKLSKIVATRLAAAKRPDVFAVERTVSFFRTRIGHVPVRIESIINDSCSRKRSDVRKKLEWLKASVNPSVQELIKIGYHLEVLKALGLDDNAYGPLRETGPLGPYGSTDDGG